MIIKHLLACSLLLSLTGCTDTLGELPDFKIKTSDHTVQSVNSYIKGKPAMIVHFDSDCKACQDEAEGIIKNLNQFGDIRIVFSSIQEFDKINLFNEYFNLSKYSNITVGQDYTNTIPTHFQTYTTPLIALIDRNLHVQSVIVGEIEMWELKKFINEIN